MIRFQRPVEDDFAITREPVSYVDPYASLPVHETPIVEPTVYEKPIAPTPAVYETPIVEPTPTVSDPADWKYAAAMNEPVSEPVGSWQSELKSDPLPTPIEPTIVVNKYEDPAWETVKIDPISPNKFEYYEDAVVSPVAIYTPPVEVTSMKYPLTCECIDYPCDCDGDGTITPIIQKIDLPLPYEPHPPIVELPVNVTPVKLPSDVPVNTYPPTVNVTTQTPTTQTPTTTQAPATGEPADDETPLIFGYPWYYAVGAAAAGLFLLSSMDGKK